MDNEKILNTEVKYLTAGELRAAARVIKERLKDIQKAEKERGIRYAEVQPRTPSNRPRG